MARQLSRKKRIAAIGLVGVVIAGGGGAAYAYWTSGGDGSGTAATGTSTDFAVAMQPSTGAVMTPGNGTQTAHFSVTNTSAGAQTLSQVVVSVANADGSPWTAVPGCSAADYAVAPVVYTGGVVMPDDIAAGDVVTGTAAVTMNNLGTDQNACKGVPVPLYTLAS